ncbi:MAG: hypothetical protein M1504_02515 [Candidatus Marsarchaeota archaeon]|nr:hypothetical protein [Candidatus Marsarchaeota archaeon]
MEVSVRKRCPPPAEKMKPVEGGTMGICYDITGVISSLDWKVRRPGYDIGRVIKEELGHLGSLELYNTLRNIGTRPTPMLGADVPWPDDALAPRNIKYFYVNEGTLTNLISDRKRLPKRDKEWQNQDVIQVIKALREVCGKRLSLQQQLDILNTGYPGNGPLITIDEILTKLGLDDAAAEWEDWRAEVTEKLAQTTTSTPPLLSSLARDDVKESSHS